MADVAKKVIDMKKIISLILIMALIMCIFAISVNAYIAAPRIKVTMLNQDPDPVEPGQVVEVRFKVENTRGATNDDIEIQVVPKYPLSLYGDSAIKDLGMMRGVQRGSDAVIVDYKFKVDEKASEGETEVEIKYKIGLNSWVVYNDGEFMIDIETHDAILEVTEVDVPTENVAPGETAEVSLTIKNNADSLIKEIKVRLGVEGMSVENIPFAPIGTTAEQSFYRLDANEIIKVKYNLGIKADAASQLYNIPFMISYTDENGNKYNKTDVFGLMVGDEPEIIAYIEETDLIDSGMKGMFTVEIANSGVTDIKFVKLIIEETDAFELLSSNIIYLGDIDSDDTETEQFDAFLRSTEKNEVIVPVKLEYRDANNKAYTKSFQLPIKLYTSKEIKQMGLKPKSSAPIFIVIIIFIAGFFAYRWWKKKNTKKK